MESVNEVLNVNVDVDVDDEVMYETPSLVRTSSGSTKKEVSIVWKYFSRTEKDKDGIERAMCKHCGRSFAIGKNPRTNNSYGTSHLSRHVSTCKAIASFNMNSGETLSNQEEKSSQRKVNQIIHRNKLAKAIVKHDLPFNFVEYDLIRDWIAYISPDVVMTSRNTLVSDIKKVYTEEKEKLKQVLSKIPNRVCLTSDLWTACNSESYMCLTAHFVDENWRLVSKILNFCRMEPPHSGVELEAALFNCLKQWEIDKKVFSITLDNASANDSMQNILKNHLYLQNGLLCGGEFFHVRCSAHILNLIVHEGLNVANDALIKIRESVRHVKWSDGRMLKFQESMQQANIKENVGLRLDVCTRWNSTYMMLESAIKYKRAFDILQLIDRSYKCCPSEEEWKMGEKLCEFLEPFYEMTKIISGSSYPTSNMYFIQVYKIERILNDGLLSADVVIKNMSTRMKRKFDKYWNEYSIILAFGAVLDPRLKFDCVRFSYSKLVDKEINEEEARNLVEEKVRNLREKFEKLYREYENDFNSSYASDESSGSSNMWDKTSEEASSRKRSKFMNEYVAYKEVKKTTTGKSDLEVYLEDADLPYDEDVYFEVLNYWKVNEKRFPILSIMARDVLSIPITTVASESSFSIGGRILTKYRSSTLPDTVQMLLCARNWLHGFSLSPSDENDRTADFGSLMAESRNVRFADEIED